MYNAAMLTGRKPGVGEGCSFYHEGGHGERRWVIGWRYGIVQKIKGSMVRVELLVPRWDYNPETRKYTARPNERVWVPAEVVNEPGDTIYHGPRAETVWKERQEEKAEQQVKADKKHRAARRFSRG